MLNLTFSLLLALTMSTSAFAGPFVSGGTQGRQFADCTGKVKINGRKAELRAVVGVIFGEGVIANIFVNNKPVEGNKVNVSSDELVFAGEPVSLELSSNRNPDGTRDGVLNNNGVNFNVVCR